MDGRADLPAVLPEQPIPHRGPRMNPVTSENEGSQEKSSPSADRASTLRRIDAGTLDIFCPDSDANASPASAMSAGSQESLKCLRQKGPGTTGMHGFIRILHSRHRRCPVRQIRIGQRSGRPFQGLWYSESVSSSAFFPDSARPATVPPVRKLCHWH